jgi:NhaA family Na+:H+ antiporter
MATDIAFALGILSLLGKRVPFSIKIFLMALAVVDDLGAIVVIALFYTKGLVLFYLGLAFAVLAGLLVMRRFKIYAVTPYLIGGAIMWYFMLKSGVHATITGVLVAFAIPFIKEDGQRCPSFYLMHRLHIPVSFVILPLFALANTAVTLSSNFTEVLSQPVSLGILSGLVLGKPLGIFLVSFLVVSLGLCKLPQGISWSNIIGVGFLGGIGFTMSIFITLLAFDDIQVINTAKIIILCSSLLAGIIGYSYLYVTLKKTGNE